MSCPVFIAIIRRVLKAQFPRKQSKADYSKNIEMEKSRGHGLCLSLGWLHISEKKLLKTAILLVQELIK